MKKLLIASLLAGVSCIASAQITLSGKVSEWVDNTKVGNERTTGMVTEPTSNFALNAKEVLGNGLAARATLETSISGNTMSDHGTQIGDRQSTVGLAHKFGTVDIGRNVHSLFLAVSDNDVFSTLYGSIAGDVHNLRDLRFSNGMFLTVTPMAGVTVSYDRQINTPATTLQSYGASGQFMGVTATLARYEHGVYTSNVYALRTKYQGVQVDYSHSDDRGGVNSKGDLLGAAYQMSALTFKGSYGRTNRDVRAYALGADYAFSKRTEVGLRYRHVNEKFAANDVRQLGVGLTHLF